MVLSECKREKRLSQRVHGVNGANKKLVLHVRLRLWLDINHSTSATSSECIQCLKLIVWANELGSCESILCNS